MPESASPKLKGKKMPPWMMAVAIGGGLLLAFLLFRNRGSASAPADSGASQTGGADSGAPSTNSAPADSLSPAVLAALGTSQEQLGTLGAALAGIASGANDNLGYIANSALAGSFALGQYSVEGAFGLAAESLTFAENQAGLAWNPPEPPTFQGQPGVTLNAPGGGKYHLPEPVAGVHAGTPPKKLVQARPKPPPRPPGYSGGKVPPKPKQAVVVKPTHAKPAKAGSHL